MSNQNPNFLFQLIKSMTKAEKRYFSLYVNGQNQKVDAKFMQLFSILEKMNRYDEKDILKKIPELKAAHLPNVKAHLYKEILTSLRLLYSDRNHYTQIREQIDHALLLYNRGLYLQSLKVLERAKTLAKEESHFILILEIIQFEKLIESHFITRSIKGRATDLSQQSTDTLEVINDVTKLSNLALEMYSWYLEIGFVKNETEKKRLKDFFKENIEGVKNKQISVFGKLYYHQVHWWYYFILQDAPHYYYHAFKWVKLFSEHKNFASYDLMMYLKANHNLLLALFMLGKYEQFCNTLVEFEENVKKLESSSNFRINIQSFIYIYIAKINRHFLEGSFTEGLELIPEIEEKIKEYGKFIDEHRIMIFYYKIACLYFGSSQNEKAIYYLHQIISLNVGHLRTDIQCFARILHLLCHFELGNDDILEYLIKSTYKFLLKMEYLDDIQQEIIKFLRKSLQLNAGNLKNAFMEMKQNLESLSQNSYNQRSYYYLDIISWLESKIGNLPVETVIRRKFLERSQNDKAR